MLHTEVMFLWSNNLLFNQKIIILCVSLAIVQYNTILCKKVDNYFEVMINYIIAVTSCVQRINVMPFCSYQLPFSQMILIPSWILIGLTLFVHSWTQTLCIKWGESDLHWPWLSSCHDVSLHFSSVTAGIQQMWVRQKEFCLGCSCSTFTELSISSLLNHIASPEYLPCGFCVAAPVRHFDQQHSWWSYNDSTTLTYLVFT